MSLLGPAAIASRMASFQSSVAALNPAVAKLAEGGSSAPSTFAGTLDQVGAANTPLTPLMPGCLSGIIGEASGTGKTELQTMADAAATRHGVDPALFRALIDQESAWKTDAVSSVGAKGLCQLMDRTAAGLGVNDSYDPAQNLDGGAKYLRQMLDRNNGDLTRALACYNAGPGNVDGKPVTQWPHETQGYVKSILGRLEGR